MRKKQGCHFYINIFNLNQIVEEEEKKTGKVTHVIHALDTFFSSIEAYGKRIYPKTFTVEKITGSRLHMYVEDTVEKSFDAILDVALYAYELSFYLKDNVGKYKSIATFEIQVGCCYGKFYDFTFKTKTGEEETTIGFAANYAAKLQHVTHIGRISISENIYDELQVMKQEKFVLKADGRIMKYGQVYYTAELKKFEKKTYSEEDLEYAIEFANKVNLSDVSFSMPNSKINMQTLTKTEGRKLEGIPFFADVRGFTSQFKEDDSNLEEMAEKTQAILSSMYEIVQNKGSHIQFQGDREFALFHNYNDYVCCEDAIFAGMRVIDAVHTHKVCVGVGQAFGTMFVAKVGARGEKDLVVLGETVIEADNYEDEYAGENQLVIGEEIYQIIRGRNTQLANQFKRLNGKCYYTNVGYNKFLQNLADIQHQNNFSQKNYNGAWKAERMM